MRYVLDVQGQLAAEFETAFRRHEPWEVNPGGRSFVVVECTPQPSVGERAASYRVVVEDALVVEDS